MNAGKATIVLAGILVLATSQPAIAADEKAELRRNPFQRPVPEAVETVVAEGGGAKVLENPGLRAVLAAGSRSVVNFGGVIMQVGDTVDGYELLAVREGTAVFRNKGKEVVFTLYDQPRGNE